MGILKHLLKLLKNTSNINKITDIQGTCIHPDYQGKFAGEIILELRKYAIYYTWTIHKSDGSFLASVSRSVSFRVMPSDKNSFDYALSHAIEGINKYRMLRKKAFIVDKWEWRKK